MTNNMTAYGHAGLFHPQSCCNLLVTHTPAHTARRVLFACVGRRGSRASAGKCINKLCRRRRRRRRQVAEPANL